MKGNPKFDHRKPTYFVADGTPVDDEVDVGPILATGSILGGHSSVDLRLLLAPVIGWNEARGNPRSKPMTPRWLWVVGKVRLGIRNVLMGP